MFYRRRIKRESRDIGAAGEFFYECCPDTTAGILSERYAELGAAFKRIAEKAVHQPGYEARDAANDAGTRDIIVKVKPTGRAVVLKDAKISLNSCKTHNLDTNICFANIAAVYRK